MSEFPEFPKIARLTRECTITEKIDGSNGLIRIEQEFVSVSQDGQTTGPTGNLVMRVGSRTRWVTPTDDNYGFCAWAYANKEELLKLGEGDHYGEWWGSGIQKRYINQPKTFSLFNTKRWADDTLRPKCCAVVPILYQGVFSGEAIQSVMNDLITNGSKASPGCMRPEGIIIWHNHAQVYFKKTLEKDTEWKGKTDDTHQPEVNDE